MSTSIYKPAVGQINLNFTSLEAIQNVENINPIFTPLQPVSELISPLTVAQYALYNTDLEDDNFGLDNIDYLGYRGGFITAGNKVNTKLGNFTITGNLTAHEIGYFYKSINVNNTPIKNIKRKGSFANFVNEVYNTTDNDGEVLTVGDFREFRYPLGVVMLWSGDFATLQNHLPYWRLCAPPDSGNTVNGVFVPNLEGSFVIGAGYSKTELAPLEGDNLYQPLDNNLTNFGTISSLNIGLTGGYNGVYLTTGEIASHNHDISHAVTGGETTLTSSKNTLTLYNSGGNFTVNIKTASNRCYSNKPFPGCTDCTPNGSPPSCWCTGGAPKYVSTFYETGRSVSDKIEVIPFITTTVSVVDNPLTVTSITETSLGNNVSHENRPPFYTLCYIINVGQGR